MSTTFTRDACGSRGIIASMSRQAPRPRSALAKNLRRFRDEATRAEWGDDPKPRAFSVDHLAALTGIGRHSLYAYERGDRMRAPRPETLALLAAAFARPIEHFAMENPPPPDEARLRHLAGLRVRAEQAAHDPSRRIRGPMPRFRPGELTETEREHFARSFNGYREQIAQHLGISEFALDDFASWLGIPHATVCSLLYGERGPSGGLLRLITDRVGAKDPSALLGPAPPPLAWSEEPRWLAWFTIVGNNVPAQLARDLQRVIERHRAQATEPAVHLEKGAKSRVARAAVDAVNEERTRRPPRPRQTKKKVRAEAGAESAGSKPRR